MATRQPPSRSGSREFLENPGPTDGLPRAQPRPRPGSQEFLDRAPAPIEASPRRPRSAARSASQENLDMDPPKTQPLSASRECLDKSTTRSQPGPPPPSYERRFQTNAGVGVPSGSTPLPSSASLYDEQNQRVVGRAPPGGRSYNDRASRTSSVASLSGLTRSAPTYSQKPYYPNYTAARYARPKHISTTREPGYYNLNTDTVVRTKKYRTKTFLYVGRPWTKGFSTMPRDFMPLAVVSLFFFPPLGLAAIICAVLSRRAAVEEDYLNAFRNGRSAFWLSVSTVVIGVVSWIVFVALINNGRFVGHRIH